MQHKITINRVDGNYEVTCSQCGKLSGVFFTQRKAQTSGRNHEAQYNIPEYDFKAATDQVEEIAKSSNTWEEFHNRVMSNKKLIKLAGGSKSLSMILQRSEAGLNLD